jgi:LysM repeat protein
LPAQTQAAVNQLGTELATLDEKVKHIEEAHVAKAAKGPKGEPAVAGPGEYIVKPGDTGSKIARANGCSLSDLESVNPGVSWTHLKVGEKLKLPERRSDSGEPALWKREGERVLASTRVLELRSVRFRHPVRGTERTLSSRTRPTG